MNAADNERLPVCRPQGFPTRADKLASAVEGAAGVQLGRSEIILREEIHTKQSWLPIGPLAMYNRESGADFRLDVFATGIG